MMNLKELRRIAEYWNNPYKDPCHVYEWIEVATPSRVLELISRLEEAEAVIGFYGDRKNWKGYSSTPITDFDVDLDPNCEDIYTEGKRAREFLAKWKENGT